MRMARISAVVHRKEMFTSKNGAYMSFSRLRASLNSAAPAYLALTCFGMAASPALAQDTSTNGADQTSQTRLGGVTVTDTAIDDTIKVDQPASPKFTQPLQDTPQTIQVISKELFNQQGATTLTEALRNSPGIGTFSVGENGNTTSGDAIFMRGFDTSNSIFVDGVRDLGSISRDIFNTEQIDVIKGPAGTDNGRTAPSGSINMASKQANLDSAVSALASVGTDDQKRVTVDVNQAVGANAAVRLNALWQDSGVPGRDHVKDKRIGIAPSVGIGLGTDTRAWVNFLYIKQDNIPDGGVPTLGLPGWTPEGTGSDFGYFTDNPVSSENFYGTRDDHDDVRAYMGTFRFEHDVSDSVRISNIARWGKTTQKYLITSFMQPTAVDPSDPSSFTISRTNNTKDVDNQILADQLNLRADFATGSIEHSLSTGVEFTWERQVDYRQLVTGSRPAANLLNPDWNDAGTLSITRNGDAPITSRGQTETQSFYLFDTAKLFDGSLLVTGGIRFDHYKTTYWASGQCVAPSRGSPPEACGGVLDGRYVTTADLSASDTLFNWKLGAVYKPVESLSLYVNYAISQQPPGGSNFTLATGNNANNPNFDPQKAETIEAGVKWNGLGERLAVNAAIFQTTVKNEIFTDPTDPGNPQAGEKRVKGIELSTVGQITDAWSISAGYSHLNSKIRVGSTVTADGTPNLLYTPGDSFTLWTNYVMPFGLEIAGGVRHNDGLHKQSDGADTNGVPATTEGYTVVDAMLAYPVTENIKLRVNAYNLFDKHYVASINKSGYRYKPGTPQTFLFTADVRF